MKTTNTITGLGARAQQSVHSSMVKSFWLYVCRIEAYRRFGGIKPRHHLYLHESHFTAESALHYTGVDV